MLLLMGHVLRAKVAVLRRLFLSASLLAGLMGLVLLKLAGLIEGTCEGASYLAAASSACVRVQGGE